MFENAINSIVKLATWRELPDADDFFDDVLSNDISREDAEKIVDAYENGADSEYSVAKVTDIDAWTCKFVLDKADEYNLLK